MSKHQQKIERLDAVVTPTGRIGMVADIRGEWTSVQFGAGGPFRSYKLASLRWATEGEVKAAGMHGVGFNVRA